MFASASQHPGHEGDRQRASAHHGERAHRGCQRHDRDRRRDARHDQRPQARVVARRGPGTRSTGRTRRRTATRARAPARRSVRAGGRRSCCDTRTTAPSPSAMPAQAATPGRSPIVTPTNTGTIAASTAVTGEITFIGAVTISWYMIETPISPASPPSVPNSTTRRSRCRGRTAAGSPSAPRRPGSCRAGS